MTIGILQFSYGLIPVGLFGAFLIIIGGLIFGLIAAGIETRTKTKINQWLLLISILTFISIVAFFIIARIQDTITDKRAEQIITALDIYRRDNGKYPDRLELLSNNYLDKVPSTAYGIIRQNFEYTLTTPDKYELYYYSYIGVEHWYDSKTNKWRVDD